jgi:hypothetical protein
MVKATTTMKWLLQWMHCGEPNIFHQQRMDTDYKNLNYKIKLVHIRETITKKKKNDKENNKRKLEKNNKRATNAFFECMVTLNVPSLA